MIIVMVYALALVVYYPILGFTSCAVGERRGLELTLKLPFLSIFWGGSSASFCGIFRVSYAIRLETNRVIYFILYSVVDSLIS